MWFSFFKNRNWHIFNSVKLAKIVEILKPYKSCLEKKSLGVSHLDRGSNDHAMMILCLSSSPSPLLFSFCGTRVAADEHTCFQSAHQPYNKSLVFDPLLCQVILSRLVSYLHCCFAIHHVFSHTMQMLERDKYTFFLVHNKLDNLTREEHLKMLVTGLILSWNSQNFWMV